MTIHLSVTESLNYAVQRAALRNLAAGFARKQGRRFVQLVAADGRIVDVVEVA